MRPRNQPMMPLGASATKITSIQPTIQRFIAEEEGVTLVEYTLMVGLLAATGIAIFYGLGQNIQGLFTTTNTAVGTANAGITSVSAS